MAGGEQAMIDGTFLIHSISRREEMFLTDVLAKTVEKTSDWTHPVSMSAFREFTDKAENRFHH